MTEEEILNLKKELWARAKKRWPDDKEHQNRYVFGTLNKIKEKMYG